MSKKQDGAGTGGKNPAAVALGRLGGAAPRKGKRGLAALTPERRREIAAMGGAKSRTGEAGQAYIERQKGAPRPKKKSQEKD